jgi:hypothetical protein
VSTVKQLTCLLVLAACGKGEPAPEPVPPPPPPKIVPMPRAPDLDIVNKATASMDVTLDAKPTTHIVAVRPRSHIEIRVEHVSGGLGTTRIEMFEPGATQPFSANDVTCAEGNCGLTTGHEVGPNIHWVTVKLDATGFTEARLTAIRK